MLLEIRDLYNRLEDRRKSLIKTLHLLSDKQLRFQPAPDRWSILMVLQHIVLGEQGIRQTHEELRHNSVRDRLAPGNMFDIVMDVLNNDVPVEVPDPAVEPDGTMSIEELTTLWEKERDALYHLLDPVTEDTAASVMFSHPAAGPLDAVRTLRLAVAHFDTHLRQINSIPAPPDSGHGEVSNE